MKKRERLYFMKVTCHSIKLTLLINLWSSKYWHASVLIREETRVPGENPQSQPLRLTATQPTENINFEVQLVCNVFDGCGTLTTLPP